MRRAHSIHNEAAGLTATLAVHESREISTQTRVVSTAVATNRRSVSYDPIFPAPLQGKLLRTRGQHHDRLPEPRPRKSSLSAALRVLLTLTSAMMALLLPPQGQAAGHLSAETRPLLRPILRDVRPEMAQVDERTGRLYITTDKGLQVLDGHTGTILFRVATVAGPLALDDRTGRIFVVRDFLSDGVSVLDAHGGRVVHKFSMLSVPGSPYHGGWPVALAVDGRTRRLFVALEHVSQPRDEFHYSDALAVSTLDADSGRVLRTLYLGRAPAGIAVDERTGRVFVSTVHTVDVLDSRTGALLATVSPSVQQGAHLFLRQPVAERIGRLFVINYMFGGGLTSKRTLVSMLDARNGHVLVTVPGSAVAVDERGLQTAPHAYVGDGDHITVLDTRNGSVLYHIRVGLPPTAMAVDEYNGHLVVVSIGLRDAFGLPEGNGTVQVFDPHSGAVLRTATVGPGPSTVLVVQRTGRALVLSTGLTRERPSPRRVPGSVAMLDLLR